MTRELVLLQIGDLGPYRRLLRQLPSKHTQFSDHLPCLPGTQPLPHLLIPPPPLRFFQTQRFEGQTDMVDGMTPIQHPCCLFLLKPTRCSTQSSRSQIQGAPSAKKTTTLAAAAPRR